MRPDVWRRVVDRFGPVGVLEFYASTEGTAVLANADGRKIGALGRPLPGSAELLVAQYDYATRKLSRSPDGLALPCAPGEPGMLLSAGARDGVLAAETDTASRVVTNVREPDDMWVATGDIVRVDDDGDYWFVDRASDTVLTAAGPVSTFEVENALYRVPGVELAIAFGLPVPGTDAPMTVAVVKQRGASSHDPSGAGRQIDGVALLEAVEALPRRAWPRFVRIAPDIPMTGGFRPLKRPLREEGIRADHVGFRYDDDAHAYLPIDEAGFAATIGQLGGQVGGRPAAASVSAETP
jgi:putative long chain acyl-CoA synthase